MIKMSCHDPFIDYLRRVLKLPNGTRSFTLRASVDDVVTVEVEYLPDQAMPGDEYIIKTFELVEKQ